MSKEELDEWLFVMRNDLALEMFDDLEVEALSKLVLEFNDFVKANRGKSYI